MDITKQADILTAPEVSAEQLEKINRQAKSPLKAEEVYVFSVRLCDDQADRDFERFSQQALQQLAPMFIGKTGIVDHNWNSDNQVARIFDAGVEYQDGVCFIRAWAYILRCDKNQNFIREIEAGIKKEVSVGCAMGRSICSVCGADYGSCEHHKGEKYGGELCTAVLCEPVDAYEFSFVAVPAQREAGVLKKLRGGEDRMKELEEEAAFGRICRKEAEQEVVRLAMVLDLGVEESVLRRMAAGLDGGELLHVKKKLTEKTEELFPPVCQLGSVGETAQDSNSAFLI